MANPNSATNGAQVQNQGNLAVMPSMTLGPIDIANLANPHFGELDELAEALAEESPEVREAALLLLSPKRQDIIRKLIAEIEPHHSAKQKTIEQCFPNPWVVESGTRAAIREWWESNSHVQRLEVLKTRCPNVRYDVLKTAELKTIGTKLINAGLVEQFGGGIGGR